MTTMTDAPRTEAGRDMLGFFGNLNEGDRFSLSEFAVAIEAEARGELRAAIETLPWTTMSEQRGVNGQYVDRAAVLALLDAVAP